MLEAFNCFIVVWFVYTNILTILTIQNYLHTFFIHKVIHIMLFSVQNIAKNNGNLLGIMRRKGFYIKKGKEGSVYIHLYVADFQQYINDIKGQDGWVTLRMFEREQPDEKGHTHNLEAIKQNKSAND